MIGNKTTREDFLRASLKEMISAENILKRIYERIPYVCNLTKNSGSIEDCQRILGMKVDKDEVAQLDRDLQYFKLNMESSVSKLTSLVGTSKQSFSINKEDDDGIIKTLRIASSRIFDLSKYTSSQIGIPENETETANSFLLNTNQKYGIKELFKTLKEQISSIQSELSAIDKKNVFFVNFPCGIKNELDKNQTVNFLKQVILSREPLLEDSLSIPEKQTHGFLSIGFGSKDDAEKARAAIVTSFKNSGNVDIKISSDINKKSRGNQNDFSI